MTTRTANDYARDLVLRFSAIKPANVDDIANLFTTSFQEVIDAQCGRCVRLADDRLRMAAELCDIAAREDESNNGVAQTGAAIGLGDKIRALTLTGADGVSEDEKK